MEIVNLSMGSSYIFLAFLSVAFGYSNARHSAITKMPSSNQPQDQLVLAPLLFFCSILRIIEWFAVSNDDQLTRVLSVIEILAFYLFVLTKWILLAGFLRLYLNISSVVSSDRTFGYIRKRITVLIKIVTVIVTILAVSNIVTNVVLLKLNRYGLDSVTLFLNTGVSFLSGVAYFAMFFSMRARLNAMLGAASSHLAVLRHSRIVLVVFYGLTFILRGFLALTVSLGYFPSTLVAMMVAQICCELLPSLLLIALTMYNQRTANMWLRSQSLLVSFQGPNKSPATA